ncbi:MAG: response regulator [Candidatus Omnitrophota bacterium]|jgi:CheY-like chemotaxis protein
MQKKILAVDDDPHILLLVKTRLQANGYQVVTAVDGEECIQKLLSEKPDLLILDVMLPKMDGYNVLITLKEMRMLGKNIPKVPVIMLTARGEPRIRELIEKEDIKAYILKPFYSKELLETIKKIIG